MSEDDTFNTLRRTPFIKVIEYAISRYSPRSSIDEVIGGWSRHYTNWTLSSDNCWPSVKMIEFYKSHGWTFRELLDESVKYKKDNNE